MMLSNFVSTATLETLPTVHPLRRFLRPFTFRTPQINKGKAYSFRTPLCPFSFQFDLIERRMFFRKYPQKKLRLEACNKYRYDLFLNALGASIYLCEENGLLHRTVGLTWKGLRNGMAFAYKTIRYNTLDTILKANGLSDLGDKHPFFEDLQVNRIHLKYLSLPHESINNFPFSLIFVRLIFRFVFRLVSIQSFSKLFQFLLFFIFFRSN